MGPRGWCHPLSQPLCVIMGAHPPLGSQQGPSLGVPSHQVRLLRSLPNWPPVVVLFPPLHPTCMTRGVFPMIFIQTQLCSRVFLLLCPLSNPHLSVALLSWPFPAQIFFLRAFLPVVVNLMCHFDWATGCPDIWSDVIFCFACEGVSGRG